MAGLWSHTRTLRWLLAWLVCLVAAGVAIGYAWKDLDDPRRVDGNAGHVNIDFSSQYILGRMLLAGQAPDFYDRHAQSLVMADMFPVAAQDPNQPKHDAHVLGDWFLGSGDRAALEMLTSTLAPLAADSPLGLVTLVAALPPEKDLRAARQVRQVTGPLYPPIHAYVMAPLALLPTQMAYRTAQVLNLLLAFLLGFGASRWSQGRFWWPMATLLLMLFPGFAGAINLGQNPLVSLALLSLGWWLVSVNRPGWGGLVWGLLAFKPVWAITYFVAALATRRWRLALSMGATGALLILMTLPLGGIRPWFEWVTVGSRASALYDRDTNWVHLSRDVQNLPRRLFLDFPPGGGVASSPCGRLPDVLGVSLWLGVVGVWLLVLVRTRAPSWDGPMGAFTLLGAWLACWHFMYYETLLAALPVFLLLRGPGRAGGFPWVVLVLLIGTHYANEILVPSQLGPPWDTLLLLALWGWCFLSNSKR